MKYNMGVERSFVCGGDIFWKKTLKKEEKKV